MKKITFISLFCCLLYSAGAQTLFTSDSFPGQFFYLATDNNFRKYPPCEGWADTIYSSNWNFHRYGMISSGDTVRLSAPIPGGYLRHRIDTVAVWKMVVDTSVKLSANYPAGRPVRLMHLLEVREWHNTREGNQYWADCLNCVYQDYPKHITYLLRPNMHLPFTWVVIDGDFVADANPEMELYPAPTLSEPDHEQYGGISPISFRGDTSLLSTSLNTGWTEISFRTGPGVIKGKGPEGTIYLMDCAWMPRRLQKRFKKFYHLKP